MNCLECGKEIEPEDCYIDDLNGFTYCELHARHDGDLSATWWNKKKAQGGE